ncbi:hypothetical protein C7S18_01945 [Ahniella affigens]|uniref:Abnormal spindle-like microcephaly-associated protein ASH domain-containing protein n=1 Tax=Ahniella affigens TaxID=2021234 RepID=A0A2P1PMG1_9GAMM|nr:hypothetical protein [Ahniella affigens]AVP96028.1 hypothetical protein C7S18_01945 [Ahniella affigens]
MKLSARCSAILLLVGAGGASAGTFTFPNTVVTPGAPLETVDIFFAGDGDTQDAGVDLDTPADVTLSAGVVLVAGSICSNVDANTVRIVPPSGAGTPLTSTSTAYCRFSVDSSAVPGPGVDRTLVLSPGGLNDCTGNVNSGPCTFTSGTLQIRAGAQVGPTVTYTPAPNAAPATVTFGAAGSIGGTTTSNVAVSGAGGSNGGNTTIDQCQLATGTGVSFVAFTNMVCTNGGSCTDGTDANITATCTATNAQQTGTFTCRERRQNEAAPGDGTVVTTTQTWGFTCPAANVNPTITPATASGSNVNTSTVGQGQTSTATFSFTPSGGSGTGSSTVTGCTIAAPFSIVPANPTLTFTGSGTTAQSFNVTCTAGAAAQGPQALACTVGGAAYSVNVTCPAGLPVAAPIMTADPVEDADDTSDASAEVTFSAPLGLAGNSTSTINLDVSGGIDDATGTAETVAITGCAISNNGTGNISITTPPAATAFGTGDPAGDVDTSIGLRCNGNAAATTALLTCTVNSVASGTTTPDTRIWDIACPAAVTAPEVSTNPASPGVINVQGQPGNSVAATVAFTNTGDAPLTVDTCTATTDDPNITFTPPASPIAINGGTGSLDFSCTAPTLNATITETVTCNTNDADEATVSFTLNCTGANLLPIPAINGLGKALMAALIIGLGLIGLGLRRQTA